MLPIRWMDCPWYISTCYAKQVERMGDRKPYLPSYRRWGKRGREREGTDGAEKENMLQISQMQHPAWKRWTKEQISSSCWAGHWVSVELCSNYERAMMCWCPSWLNVPMLRAVDALIRPHILCPTFLLLSSFAWSYFFSWDREWVHRSRHSIFILPVFFSLCLQFSKRLVCLVGLSMSFVWVLSFHLFFFV